MKQSARLLGFAFACADLLLEVDANGVVTFAGGAAPSAEAKADALVGQTIDAIVEWGEHSGLLAQLKPGRRSGAIDVGVRSGGSLRAAQLHAFAPAQIAPNICCAIAYAEAMQEVAADDRADAPLPDRTAFEAAALSALATAEGELTLAIVTAPPEGAGNPLAGLWRRVERALFKASVGGGAAAALGEGQVALLHNQRDGSIDDLVSRALGGVACHDVSVEQANMQLGVDPVLGMRALRYALDTCIEEGASRDGKRLKRSLDAGLAKTLREAESFRRNVSRGAFVLHFQPVVDLQNRKVQHYEALVRFQSGESPAGIIHMANELGLITELDVAVAQTGIAKLLSAPIGTRLAINVSEAALASDQFLEAILTGLPKGRRGDLILEINEAAASRDVEAMAQRLSRLKREGFGLSLDDFASAQNSLDLLSKLPVDWVKLDSGLTRRLDSDPKAITVLTHVDRMCRALGKKSTAREIETERTVQLLLGCGVATGQGFLLGRPIPEITTQARPSQRQGFRESWG
jgi:EAL domain-containing protein (putative c-di-GMP-specific phosphodiesterase class I)